MSHLGVKGKGRHASLEISYGRTVVLIACWNVVRAQGIMVAGLMLGGASKRRKKLTCSRVFA
jgi:hypothetical protein